MKDNNSTSAFLGGRSLSNSGSPNHLGGGTADDDALNELTAQLSRFNWKDGVVDHAKRLLFSDSVHDNLKGVLNLKAMLCIGREEVYEVAQEVIDSGVIARLVEFLRIENKELQLASAFCLTNIAAGLDDQTGTVVEAGALEPLIGFLRSRDHQLRRQAIFCLANVGGSTPEYRIMLARHPLYFESMFEAVSNTQDPKILELVCWNLRNVCLLGGPTLADIEIAVQFLVENIIDRHWAGSSCAASVRFAMETVAAVCRTMEGRELLLKLRITDLLLNIVYRLHSSSVSQSALEALAWITAFGGECERETIIRCNTAIDSLIQRICQGSQFGSMNRELSLKCLVCLTSDIPPDLLFNFVSSHDNIIDVCFDAFVCTKEASIDGSNNNDNLSSETSAVGCREFAGYIFCQCLSCAYSIDKLLLKVLVNPEVVKILLDIVELSSDQIRVKNAIPSDSSLLISSANNGGKTYQEFTGLQQNSNPSPSSASINPDSPSAGPPLPLISENLAIVSLKGVLLHLKKGLEIQKLEGLPENPIVKVLIEYEGPERLQQILNSTPLPPEAYKYAVEILQGHLGLCS